MPAGLEGYCGRLVFAELLEADDVLRQAIAANLPRAKIEEIAAARGMVTLRDAGERLVKDGLTTPEELRRVLG